jgi:hypothetical protein
LDGPAHQSDDQNQENPLHSICDSISAKNLELEAKLAEMTEKVANSAEELQKIKANFENQLTKQMK